MVNRITGKVINRPFLILFLSSVIPISLSAQTLELPVNGEGRVEFSKTVESDSISYFTLWDNAIAFLRTLSVPDQLTKEVQCNEPLTQLKHQFGFHLYVKPMLTKQIDGVIIADLTINVEKSKYHYQIDNFRFIQYARNRFGQFVPKSSRKYPLEKYYPENQNKKWRGHFEDINVKINNIAAILESNMSELRKIDK